ncbi:MAG: hypothetical protein SGJ26_12915 [Nitrospirota bacterium]|nr:hypothetical protein [Nitrospirota bacterium]
MNGFAKFDATLGVSDVYVKTIGELHKRFHLHTTIKILVVVDGGSFGSISLTEAPSGFGVGRVVRLLRESHIGCTHFEVDTARRDSSTAGSPNYSSFRFDRQEAGQPVLNKYHEVWCFGFNPDNNAGPDSNITHPGALPMGDTELTALTTWMNDRRGGLLAMGDHDYLGASMCHRIPRIRSMRRWTNAQGVPPIGGAGNPDTHLRHDTNQPFTAAQLNGTAVISFSNQEDSKPQSIDWVPWISQQVSIFQVRQRPHPILCHPVHGPIDVMPDHPHEGWCYEDDEIDLTAPLGVPTLTGSEYPTVGGNQPRPMIIAHGTTTPNPPFMLAKGPSPKKRFGMISVYDGHPGNVGRVATDSTWHHWFDENIQDIEAAGGANWDKISRYYLNVAKWLAPPSVSDWCIVFDIITTHFTYLGFQEYSKNASVFDLGQSLHTHLVRHVGPCWVTQWVFDRLQLVDADFWAWLKDRPFWKNGIPLPGSDPCLSCPPFELIEIAVLGGMVRASFPIAEEIKAQVEKQPDHVLKMEPERIVKQQLEGVKIGMKEFRSALAKSIKQMEPLLR